MFICFDFFFVSSAFLYISSNFFFILFTFTLSICRFCGSEASSVAASSAGATGAAGAFITANLSASSFSNSAAASCSSVSDLLLRNLKPTVFVEVLLVVPLRNHSIKSS